MQHILYLKIENDIRSAKVTEINHPHHQLYHVIFEDGYENIFFTDAETGNWIEEDLGETALAASFGNRIDQVDGHYLMQPKQLTWCRATLANIAINFGFCSYMEKGARLFEVYSDNRKFLCSLVKNKKGKWLVYEANGSAIEQKPYPERIQIIISIFEGMANQ